MLLNDLRCSQMPSDASSSQMFPDASRCSEMLQEWFRCFQVLPDGGRCSQMFPYANACCESCVHTLTRIFSPGPYEASAWSDMRFSLLPQLLAGRPISAPEIDCQTRRPRQLLFTPANPARKTETQNSEPKFRCSQVLPDALRCSEKFSDAARCS